MRCTVFTMQPHEVNVLRRGTLCGLRHGLVAWRWMLAGRACVQELEQSFTSDALAGQAGNDRARYVIDSNQNIELIDILPIF